MSLLKGQKQQHGRLGGLKKRVNPERPGCFNLLEGFGWGLTFVVCRGQRCGASFRGARDDLDDFLF